MWYWDIESTRNRREEKRLHLIRARPIESRFRENNDIAAAAVKSSSTCTTRHRRVAQQRHANHQSVGNCANQFIAMPTLLEALEEKYGFAEEICDIDRPEPELLMLRLPKRTPRQRWVELNIASSSWYSMYRPTHLSNCQITYCNRAQLSWLRRLSLWQFTDDTIWSSIRERVIFSSENNSTHSSICIAYFWWIIITLKRTLDDQHKRARISLKSENHYKIWWANRRRQREATLLNYIFINFRLTIFICNLIFFC